MKADKSKHGADGKLKNGVVKEYFKDGTLSCVGKFRNGEKVGEWKYYLRNGVLRAVGMFAEGKLTGEWKWYRENGKLMQTGSFEAEKKTASGNDTIPTEHCTTRANSPTTRRSVNGGRMTPRES